MLYEKIVRFSPRKIDKYIRWASCWDQYSWVAAMPEDCHLCTEISKRRTIMQATVVSTLSESQFLIQTGRNWKTMITSIFYIYYVNAQLWIIKGNLVQWNYYSRQSHFKKVPWSAIFDKQYPHCSNTSFHFLCCILVYFYQIYFLVLQFLLKKSENFHIIKLQWFWLMTLKSLTQFYISTVAL